MRAATEPANPASGGRDGATVHEPIILRRRMEPGLWLPAAFYLLLALCLAGRALPAELNFLPPSPIASASVIAMLTSVASGMMALTAIVFSFVFLGLQFGATAYTPRLIHEFARRPLTGHALGVFSGTFVYSILSVRVVDQAGTTGVSQLVMWIALAWVLASVVLLVLVATGPQQMSMSNVLDQLTRQGLEAVARLYPTLRDGHQSVQVKGNPTFPQALAVTQAIRHSGRLSYLQTLKADKLIEAARRAGGVIMISRAVGDPVAPGETVAVVLGAKRAVSWSLVRSGLKVGQSRHLKDDPGFALRLLVDIAIRALSPAVNDPTTAVEVLDEVEQLLIAIGRSRFDDELLPDADGKVRVVYAGGPTWEDVLALALVEIQQYGRDSYQVQRRVGALLRRLTAELPGARKPAIACFEQRRQVAIGDGFSHEDDRSQAAARDLQGLGHTLHDSPD